LNHLQSVGVAKLIQMWVAYIIMKLNRLCALGMRALMNNKSVAVIGERRRRVIDRNLCSCFLVRLFELMYLRALFALLVLS
jgi:hypothetical protein